MTKRGPKLRDVDALFSKYIRARDGKCVMPRLAWVENGVTPCVGYLQAAHVISRRYHGTRFDERNCYALCLGHHKWETEHPIEGRWMWQQLIGVELYSDLEQQAYLGVRGRLDLKAIAADLREKIAQQEAAA